MAYIEAGQVKDKRSLWRLSIFSDIFWAILSYLGIFFTTMFSLEAAESYGKSRSSRQSGPGGAGRPGGWGPNSGGGGGDGFGGGRPSRPVRGVSNIRGIDHYAPSPSCAGGSCGL